MNDLKILVWRINMWPVRIGDEYIFSSHHPESTETGIQSFDEKLDVKDGLVRFGTRVQKIIQNIVLNGKRLISRWSAIISNGKKQHKSADQILDELGVKPIKESSEFFFDEDDIFSEAIQLPFGRPGENKPVTDVEVGYALKEINLSFTSQGGVKVSLEKIHGRISHNLKNQKIPSQDYIRGTESVIILMMRPELVRDLRAVINAFNDPSQISRLDKIKELQTKVENLRKSIIGTKFTFDPNNVFEMEQIINITKIFQEVVQESQDMQNKFLTPNDPREAKSKEFVSLNSIASDIFELLMAIQMSINTLSTAFDKINVIDKRYEGSVTDIRVLSKFVNSMIESGIPPRYVSFNVFKVSSSTIKGSGKSSNPIWGQTRLVLFPSDKPASVYKIAINPLGKNSNLAESTVYAKIKNTKYEAYFAQTRAITDNHTILEMERIPDPGTSEDVTNIKNALGDMSRELRIPDVQRDIHSGNVGRRGSQSVCFDYGFLGPIRFRRSR